MTRITVRLWACLRGVLSGNIFDIISSQIVNKVKRCRCQNDITNCMKIQVERTLKRIVKMRYEDGVLKVVANCFVTNKKLREIIEQNSEWIRQQKRDAIVTKSEQNLPVKSFPQVAKNRMLKNDRIKTNESSLKADIFSGKKTLLMGDVISVVSGCGARTYLDGSVLYINEKFCQSREARLKAIRTYLKKMAQLYVSTEIADFGSKVSLCPTRIEFREIGEFWLKCSMASQRILSFDFRIVQLPKNLRAYLIAHAFAHFIQPIHDDKFSSFVADFIPRCQECQRQLETYHYLLDR